MKKKPNIRIIEVGSGNDTAYVIQSRFLFWWDNYFDLGLGGERVYSTFEEAQKDYNLIISGKISSFKILTEGYI